MDLSSGIFVAGHRGLVGSSVLRKLADLNYANLLTSPARSSILPTPMRCSNSSTSTARNFVFLCAAKVGGNSGQRTYPGDFIRENLAIQWNVIEASRPRRRTPLAVSGVVMHLIRETAPSPSKRNICSQARSNPPIAPMPWPRSRASRCAGRTTSSIGPISYP